MNPDRGRPLAVLVAAAATILLVCVAILVLRRPDGLDDEPGIAMSAAATPTVQAGRSAGPLMTPSASPPASPTPHSNGGATTTGDSGVSVPEVVQQAPPQDVSPQDGYGSGYGGTTSNSGAGTTNYGGTGFDYDYDDDYDDDKDDDDGDDDD